MPELPEVETVVRDLLPLVVGRTVHAVRHSGRKLRKPWKAAWNARIAGRRIEAIRRRGKWIVLELGEPRLLIHLGMSGRLTIVPQEPARHRHLAFELDNGSEIQFFDPRRFGAATLLENASEEERFFEQLRLGPEPQDLLAPAFHAAARSTTRNLKSILLDQRIVAGLGNIYANEACFLARISPQRIGHSLTAEECARLVKAIQAVIRQAIEYRGTTLEDEGYSGGGFQERLQVYGRDSRTCRKCPACIVRIVISSRATYYCPACQPLPT